MYVFKTINYMWGYLIGRRLLNAQSIKVQQINRNLDMLIGYLRREVFNWIVRERSNGIVKSITYKFQIPYQVIIDDVVYGHTDRFFPLPNISTTGVKHYLDKEETNNYDTDDETFLTTTNTENM